MSGIFFLRKFRISPCFKFISSRFEFDFLATGNQFGKHFRARGCRNPRARMRPTFRTTFPCVLARFWPSGCLVGAFCAALESSLFIIVIFESSARQEINCEECDLTHRGPIFRPGRVSHEFVMGAGVLSESVNAN